MSNQVYNGQWFNYAPQTQQQVAPVLNNFLTPEAAASLQKNSSLITKLTEDEYHRAICTHKFNNTFTLQPFGDKHHCTTCGEDFHLIDLNTSMDSINAITEQVYDLIQSCKAYMLNVPKEFETLYMVTGLIKKLPQLWEASKKSFEQAYGQTAIGSAQSIQSNPFNTLNSIFGGVMGGGYNPNQYYNPYQQQPMYQQPMYQYQQPVPQQQYQQIIPPPGYVPQQPMYQQPVPQQQYQQPAAPGSNPIGYVAQQPQYVQQQPPVANINVQVPMANPGQPVQVPQQPAQNPNMQNPNVTTATPPNTNINK